jgi:predicted GIY-YIG superfamily endonuclease
MGSWYFVYIIKSTSNNKIYTGFTTDLQKRVKQHKDEAGGYTKGRGPWELVWYCAFKDRLSAENLESYLKSGSGIAFSRTRLIKR